MVILQGTHEGIELKEKNGFAGVNMKCDLLYSLYECVCAKSPGY